MRYNGHASELGLEEKPHVKLIIGPVIFDILYARFFCSQTEWSQTRENAASKPRSDVKKQIFI